MDSVTRFQFRYSSLETVGIGQELAQDLPPLLKCAGYRHVLVVASGSPCAATGDLDELRQALGRRWAGLARRVRAHTPRLRPHLQTVDCIPISRRHPAYNA